MNYQITKCVLLVASFLSSPLALAKIVYYGSETEVLTLAYDATTILRFDDEVKTISQASKYIIEPADPADPNYRVLSIKPRLPDGKDKVTFILVNDTVVNLRLDTVSKAIPEKTDNFYDLKTKDLKIEETKGADVSDLELMKAMVRSDNLVGYNSRPFVRAVNSGIEGISAQLIKVYTGPKFNGYIFKVENTSLDKKFAIDLKSLTLGRPNVALLSQVDDKVISPIGTGKHITLLRIVAKSTSVYSSLSLPIEPIVTK
ncbi:MAG: hypothetical protein KA436_08170 [Oligoflexales bacterium]|nr:hypothetical protein [Oligoflexales bacterium]